MGVDRYNSIDFVGAKITQITRKNII
jgi:hypothetical protein